MVTDTFGDKNIRTFFLLSADDKNPPKNPTPEFLEKWDKIGGWGDRGATLADPPNEDGKSAGLHTLWGKTFEGKDATMLLKPGAVVHAVNFQVIDNGEDFIKEAMGIN